MPTRRDSPEGAHADTADPAAVGSPRGLTALALRLARGHRAALLAVAVAVAGGAAFVTVSGVLADTGLRSHPPVERLPGADVMVAAPQTLPQAEGADAALPERRGVDRLHLEALVGLPGAGEIVGDITFPAAVLGESGPVSGPDPAATGRAWSAAPLMGGGVVEGEAPRHSGEVALDTATAQAAEVGVGDELRVVAAGETGRYRVAGVVDTESPAVLADDATAAELAAHGGGPRQDTVDLIGLSAAPGVSAQDLAQDVRERLDAGQGGELAVYTGAARGDAETPAGGVVRAMLLALSGSLSGVVALVVGFTLAGALSVSVAAQRRELALLRVVGATPRQVRRLVTAPALLVTLACLPAGTAAGYLLAGRLHALVADMGMIPANLPVTLGPGPAAATAVLMTLTVWTAARVAVSRTAGAPPRQSLADSVAEQRSPRPWRAKAGALVLLASLVLALPPLLIRSEVGIAGTATACLIAVIGLALAGPAWVRSLAAALARRLPARAAPETWLAVQNLHGHSSRVAGAVAALAIVVGFTLGQGYSSTTLLAAGQVQHAQGTLADFHLTAPELGGLPHDLLAQVHEEPSVAAAATLTPTTVLWPYGEFGEEGGSMERFGAQVLEPEASAVLDLGVTEGSLDALAGSSIALGASTARLSGVDVGDTVTLYLGDGTEAEADVVALFERELGYGPLMASSDLIAGQAAGALDATLLVAAAPSRAEEARSALDALAARYPGVRVGGGAQGGAPESLPPDTVLNFAVLLALLGYMVLAVANRLAAQTLRRGKEMATLRAVGMTPHQFRRVLRREAVLIAAGATLAGVAAVAVPLAFAGLGLLGRPWPAGPVWLLPAAAGVVAVLAWLCLDVPGRRLAAPRRR